MQKALATTLDYQKRGLLTLSLQRSKMSFDFGDGTLLDQHENDC